MVTVTAPAPAVQVKLCASQACWACTTCCCIVVACSSSATGSTFTPAPLATNEARSASTFLLWGLPPLLIDGSDRPIRGFAAGSGGERGVCFALGDGPGHVGPMGQIVDGGDDILLLRQAHQLRRRGSRRIFGQT